MGSPSKRAIANDLQKKGSSASLPALPISVQQEECYWTRGFAVIEKFFSYDDLAPVIEEIEHEVNRRAQDLYRRGRTHELFDGETFEYRLAKIYSHCHDVIRGFDIKDLLSPGLFRLFTCPKVLNLARHLLGPDLVLNPTHRLRAKLPQSLRAKWQGIEADSIPLFPVWHQDVLTPDETGPFDMLTIWVPLVNVGINNGCLEIMPDAFRLGRLPHRKDQGGRITGHALPTVPRQALPCQRRDIVIFNHLTPHCSLPNLTEGIRWGLDFRLHRLELDIGRKDRPSFLICNSENPGASSLLSYEEWRRRWKEISQAT